MNPIIGIVSRPIITEENNKMFGVYEQIVDTISEFGGIPIIILPNNIKEYFNLIDGIIFQGGDEFTDYEEKILKLCHKYNIKTLAICLGMQMMGVCFNGKIENINNHKYKDKQYVHKVNIKKNSILYKIFKQDQINVNSRHKSALSNTTLEVIGIDEDGVIEAIEDKNKDFFLGVQWHPESMITYDILERNLFNYFINKCRK